MDVVQASAEEADVRRLDVERALDSLPVADQQVLRLILVRVQARRPRRTPRHLAGRGPHPQAAGAAAPDGCVRSPPSVTFSRIAATYLSMSACTRYPDDDVVLRYVTSDLAEPDLTVFEDHLFACDACLARVERYQAAQQVLARRALPAIPTVVPVGISGVGQSPRRPMPLWLLGAIAASLVVVAGGLWSWQRVGAPSPKRIAVQVAPVEASSPSNVRNAAALQAAVLAMVAPPPYLALTTRGDGAETARFKEAMQAYTRADWATAAGRLADRGHGRARFYQGIADLMRGEVAAATTTLDAARKSGVQPYARESVFYLGKAALQRGDVEQARHWFDAARAGTASTQREAARSARRARGT